ncbi:hypothetical protein [Virgibacillus senegalensis]|uniref:hypothetical protein n=1 Tax=Virgibacillus senegalensis TaxID=1499679 RepID=UPI0018FE3B67|nr:hypothetical protein [Virgibacillus senegalensis]
MQRHIMELLGIKDKQVDVWNIEEEGSALRVELYTAGFARRLGRSSAESEFISSAV